MDKKKHIYLEHVNKACKNKAIMKYKGYIWLLIFFLACSSNQNEQLEYALQAAGKNREEMKSVLNHFKDDSLKLIAAHFLIENMPYHFSLEEYFISPEGKRYRPDISLFNEEIEVKNHCDSLFKYGYRIKTERKYDISTLDSNYLINNIELAFAVWQKPWAKDISFTDFCRYILPYRAQSEKVSNLRREIMERFLPVLDSAKVKTPLEACIILNKKFREIMEYKETGLPFYPTIDETYHSGRGLCEGLCITGTFIMRAVGIPVAVEQTIWVKMDLGHNWCTVLDNGKFYSFDPCGQQPGLQAKEYSELRHLRPAKVYRNRFDPNFTQIDKEDDGYITYLKSPLLQDVTDEYLNKPIQVEITLDKSYIKKRASQVYLCTYNYYEWQPIAIGYRNNSTCYFKNVVGDNIFIVADSPKKIGLRYITAPFYISEEGKIHKFIPQKTNKKIFTIDKRKNKLGLEHTLHYWDTDKNGFVALDYTSSTDTTQTYDQIPGNALLWFTIPERIVNQRIFFIENDSIKTY